MAAVDAVADMIIHDGASGDAALEALRETYHTLSSLVTAMSHVRAAVLDRGFRPPEYDPVPLRALNPPDVDAFLALSPRDQYAVQRAHARDPTWPDDAERALAQLRILPPALDAFRLDQRQTNQLKRQRDDAIVSKNEHLIVIHDAPALLRAAAAALESATSERSYAKLILPLLLVSGRRLTEITNGRSTFTPIGDVRTTRHATFAGQLKKKGAGATPYVIPLLVPFALFDRGLRALREKQRAEFGQLTNLAAKGRYQPNTQRDLAKGVLVGFPRGCHIHDLRSAYMRLAFELFRSQWTFARSAMACLGHESLHESHAYANVEANVGALCGSFGPLLP